MIKRCTLALLFVLLPAAAFSQTTRRYIVVTRHPAPEALRSLRNDDFEPRLPSLRQFEAINGFAADLSDDEVATLKKSNQVRWVEPVVERHLLQTSASLDTVAAGRQTTPFGIFMVHATDVWPVTKGKSLDSKTPIRVAVIDTGIRYTESELKGVYKGGFNFIAGNENPFDDHGHGTHVSGIIAAADDGVGVVGVAPEIELYGLKVLDQCGSGSSESSIAAMDWIISKKAAIGGNWIANLSLGSPDSSEAERLEFQKAADAGILIVAASGNGYDTNPVDGLSYPAGYSSVMSVGAIDSTSAIADFSQRGVDLKVVAPGVDVLSTFVSEAIATNDGREFGVIEMDATNSRGDALCFTRPSLTSGFVFCGRGNPADFPASVKGKIALIERGDLTFAVKAKNAKTAGAAAAIVYNNAPGSFGGTLGSLTSTSLVPFTVSMSQEDGLALKATPNVTLTLSFGLEGYAVLGGTSMASPHAAGVAALVWAAAPGATASTVANAIITTTQDLGAAGFDTVFGNGLVNALEAAKKLNPSAFGSGVTTGSGPVTGRRPGRRVH